jgi:hypothetical protein
MYKQAKDVSRTWGDEGVHMEHDQWRCWDEALVSQFGCWLNLLGKVFAILLFAICTAVFIGWL